MSRNPTIGSLPDVPHSQQARAEVEVRYEDITQEGRVRLEALPPAIGAACWRRLLAEHPMAMLGRRKGVLPILSRLTLEGGGGPVSVRRPLLARGMYQLAHTVDDHGEVNRLILNLYVDIEGVRGRTHGPPPENAGEPVRVGRVHAEHVFTRPFSPPGERKVLRLPTEELPSDVEPVPEVPPARYMWRPADTAAALPEGARPLEERPRRDSAPVVFGLTHSDSNQHVNSLVYPRLFEEASLRRLAELEQSTQRLARWAEIAYRKPCFPGDKMNLELQAFERDGKLGTAGAFVPPDGGKPHCFINMELED